MKLHTVVAVLLVIVVGSGALADEELFPFVVAYDAPDNVTNISGWLDKPAGKHGFIRVAKGKFVHDAGPIRFFGTNLCFDACFPTHEQADRLARRLARFGINVVRMHHMDARSIWGDSPDRLTIDPEQLERLDYLIFRLKEEGVYTNLNLHVSRKLGPNEGFPDPERRPNYDKGLDNFEPRIIELQKKYARDLLTHVNPYTGNPYTHEPAIACVEINNENALFHEWAAGALDDLADPYAVTFRTLWNAWLRKKYNTTGALREAWREGESPLGADEQLEKDGMAVFPRRHRDRTPAARRDFIDFLWDTEHAYWNDMYRFLKGELGVQAPVSGTQLNWSPVHIQAGLDYLDAHSYWRHPEFPGRPWDPRNWFVRNTAMVNSPGGETAELASKRVAGRPFSISEYNHPTPNSYAAEGLPMLAATAAFQGWDGVYSFAWSHDDDFEPRRLTSYFDIQAEPTRLVHLPACAAMFLRGDVAPAKTTVLVPLSRQEERRRLHETETPWSLSADRFGVDKLLPLIHGVALDLSERSNPAPEIPKIAAETKTFLADNGAIRWDVSQEGQGFFVVDTPRTKFFSGFVAGREFQLGDVTLAIGKTKLDWATVSLTLLEGEGFNRPGRILIAATSWRQNTDWRLENLGEDRVTLRDQWGREPVLCEGVPARITLPVAAERVTCYALDESGAFAAKALHVNADGKTQLALDPKYQTLWYEVVVE